jgi:CheY-like chemotaxis protein
MATVLIVDDSKLARIVLKKALAALKPDWEVREAANGDQALSDLQDHSIDIVIVDFNMPGLNGLQLAAEIRRTDLQMPIALVTANVQDEIIAQARALTLSFIAKPVTEEALRGFISGADLALRRQSAK